MKKINNKKTAGFTIIETMIAIALFLVVVVSGMGALLNANLLHQKSQDMRSIMDNLSFVMEDISKNLRTGGKYYCITGNDNLSNVSTNPKSSPGGQNCWGIAFESTGGLDADPNDQWVYYIGVDNSVTNRPIRIWKSTRGPYNDPIRFPYTPLTSDEITMGNGSGFLILGAEAPRSNFTGDNQQPLVIIRLVGSINYQGKRTPFSLESAVSQRVIDLPAP